MLRLGLGALAAVVLAAAPAVGAASSCGDPLACAGLRLQSAPLPWQPLSPAARFARNTYTNTPAPADARLHVLVLRPGTGAAQYAGRVHATAPGTEVLVYQSLWLRPVPDPSGETTCLTGSTHYPASRFMHSVAGAPEEWHTGTLTGGYQMDFGNSDYLRACAAHALALAAATGADGVFLDGIATVWRRYVSTIDGAMEEAWTYGTDGALLPASEVTTAWPTSPGTRAWASRRSSTTASLDACRARPRLGHDAARRPGTHEL